MYVEVALRLKRWYNKLRLLRQEIKQIHKGISVTVFFVSQFISDTRVNDFFFYLKSFKIREIEWLSVRNIGLFRNQSNIPTMECFCKI